MALLRVPLRPTQKISGRKKLHPHNQYTKPIILINFFPLALCESFFILSSSRFYLSCFLMHITTRDAHLPDLMARVMCSLSHGSPYTTSHQAHAVFLPDDGVWTMSRILSNTRWTIKAQRPSLESVIVFFADGDAQNPSILPYDTTSIAWHTQLLGSKLIPDWWTSLSMADCECHMAWQTLLLSLRAMRTTRHCIPIFVPDNWHDQRKRLSSLINQAAPLMTDQTLVLFLDTLPILLPRTQILDNAIPDRPHSSTIFALFQQRCKQYNLSYERCDTHAVVHAHNHETIFDACVLGYQKK